jgi:hypothetical protein
LLPFPGSLIFWGVPGYLRLGKELPLAGQVPLQLIIPSHEAKGGLRVPKAGWTEEPRSGEPAGLAARHRPKWPHRSREPEGWAEARENRLAHALFSTNPNDIQLYDKPAACNSQLWSADYRALLDGPRADRADLLSAARAFEAGGRFGFRFLSPAMCVGRHESLTNSADPKARKRETEFSQIPPERARGQVAEFEFVRVF